MRFVLAISAVVSLTFAAAAQRVPGPTYAERLGWPEGTRALIIHVDDAGMSHDSNVGTIKATKEGSANSFSVMMPCSWVPEIVKYIKANPEVDAGLHLTLTAEWDVYRWGPVAGKAAVPGLVDPEGCLWRAVQSVVQNATPEELEREIRSQIDRARAMGFEPTHLDSHMGTCFATAKFMERYVKIGIETGIPVMFPGGHNYFVSKTNPGTAAMARAFGKRIWDGGLPVIDDLHNMSYGWKTTDKTDRYIEALKELRPGITMMIMHCTLPSETFPHISGSGDTRLGDLNAMLDPRFAQALKDENITLTTWRELKQRRDALK